MCGRSAALDDVAMSTDVKTLAAVRLQNSKARTTLGPSPAFSFERRKTELIAYSPVKQWYNPIYAYFAPYNMYNKKIYIVLGIYTAYYMQYTLTFVYVCDMLL